MKTLFIVSSAVCLFCAGKLLWWDVSEGVAASRAMADFQLFSPEEMAKQQLRDPWGNAYRQVTSRCGDTSTSWMFSLGPDGESKTLGNDPDDITPWTGQYEWMFRMFPYGEFLTAMIVSSMIVTSSGTVLLCRRRSRMGRGLSKQEAE